MPLTNGVYEPNIATTRYQVDEPLPLTFGDSLAYADLRRVCQILREGGLCLLPSDTCYSIAALPFRRDAIGRVGRVLPGKEREAIPLSFGSLPLVEKWVKLTPRDLRAIDEFWPGPLTLVCEVKDWHDKHILADMLHTIGNIGVRISDSPVERQISTELDRPITTCAVRDENGKPVRSFDDAVSLVRGRLEETGEAFPFAAVRISRLRYRAVSTVATLQRSQVPAHHHGGSAYSIYVFRPGVIEPQRIERALRTVPNPEDSNP